MFSSLRVRLLVTYLLIIGVVLCVVGSGLILFILQNPAVDRQTYARIEQTLDVLIERGTPIQESQINWQEILTRVDHQQDLRLVVLSEAGKVIFDTRQPDSPAVTPRVRPEAQLNRGLVRDKNNQTWLFAWRPLENKSHLIGMAPRTGRVTLLFSDRIQNIFRDDLLPPLLQAGCVALILALILAIWMTRWISAPLQKMATATRGLLAEKSERVPVEGPAEVKMLARAFNEMSAKVIASQQSQRDFVANVSHELKTPLTSIQGFSQAILDGTADTPEALEQAGKVILTEAERMHRLVLDLLDLARLDAGTLSIKRDPIDMESVLREVIQKMTPLANQAQVELLFSAEDAPVLIGDADRLAQVFINLIDNGIKHSPQKRQVSVHLSQFAALAVVSIQDNGPGIPSDDVPRIFERFYQVDKSRRRRSGYGSGLGLAIVKEIIQAHDGTITVQSSQGQGSVFVVKIPLARPDDTTLAAKISQDIRARKRQ